MVVISTFSAATDCKKRLRTSYKANAHFLDLITLMNKFLHLLIQRNMTSAVFCRYIALRYQ